MPPKCLCSVKNTACDFAAYELVTPHGLQREHILFFENVFTREVWLGGIVHDPNGNWMAQIARNQCDMWSGQLLGQKYLIHDRDPLFCQRFKNIVHSIDCKTKAIPPQLQECNGYMESFIKISTNDGLFFRKPDENFSFAIFRKWIILSGRS